MTAKPTIRRVADPGSEPSPNVARPGAVPPCARTRGIAAVLAVLAPATLAAAPVDAYASWGAGVGLVAAMVTAALAVSAVGVRPGRRAARALATVAFIVWAAGAIAESLEYPARGFIVLLGTITFVAFVWPSERLRAYGHELGEAHPRRAIVQSGIAAAVFGVDAWVGEHPATPVALAALSATYLVHLGVFLRGRPALSRPAYGALAVAGLAAVAPLVFALAGPRDIASDLAGVGIVSPLAVIWLAFGGAPQGTGADGHEPGLLDVALVHPSRVLVTSFAGLCVAGTLLLGLPVSASGGDALSWLDAAFTAVSATCVTGLIVVDTPNAFGPFGEVVVLTLIQVGGLGIMVFSAAAVVLFGRRMSLSHERAAVDVVGAAGRAGLARAVRTVLLVTVVTETVTAVLLFAGFVARGEPAAPAAWRAVFTAISAFCNAGFALQTDSLVPYADSAFILAVVGTAIVLGGLGPAVVMSLMIRRDRGRMPLHARLVLWTTAVLLVGPTIAFAGLEWRGALADLGVVDKIVNATFHAVTLRTAGFNTFDLTVVHPASYTLMIVLMFVGGSPGSTAGGAKTTTITVVLLAVASAVRGHDRVDVFGRTLAPSVVMRATAVATVGMLAAVGALCALQLTQPVPFDVAVFEVVSAMGTVGLSVGGTAALDEIGKIVVMVAMFAGRVGPLTLLTFLASQAAVHAEYRYPEESVQIG